MDVMVVLPYVAGFAVMGLVSYLIYDWLISDYFKRKKGLLIRISLYEKIGNDLTYIGQRIGEEKKDDKLGHFIMVRKNKVPIERIGSENFTYDSVYGKHIAVVKFANDDYRPLVRLKDQKWYKKEKVPITKTVWVQDPDNPAQKTKVDEPVLNKQGYPTYEEISIPYREPMGITKDDRSAMRFNLSYHKRMDELFGEKKKWYEMLAMPVAFTVMAIVLLLAFGHFTNKYSEDHQVLISQIGEETNKFYANTQNNPTWMENFISKVQGQQTMQNGTPPR